jgi:hypothetical protein
VYVTVPPLPTYAGAVNATVADVSLTAVTAPTVGAPGFPPPELAPRIGTTSPSLRFEFYLAFVFSSSSYLR